MRITLAILAGIGAAHLVTLLGARSAFGSVGILLLGGIVAFIAHDRMRR